MKKQQLKQEYSAGGVVFKKNASGMFWLLGEHSGYHKWVLPKGLIEEGESSSEAAIRETEEEMGVKAGLVDKKPIHKEAYFYYADFNKQPKSTRRVEKYQEAGGQKTKVFKTVTFYLLEYESGEPVNHGWEMSQAGWFSYEAAIKKLAFKGEKQALEKARKKLIKV